jgi:hypothetical protein
MYTYTHPFVNVSVYLSTNEAGGVEPTQRRHRGTGFGVPFSPWPRTGQMHGELEMRDGSGPTDLCWPQECLSMGTFSSADGDTLM